MDNVQVITSVKINEENNSGTFANVHTPQRGLFIKPSEDVPGRPVDITGYHLVSSNENGKLEWKKVCVNDVGPKESVVQKGTINNLVTIHGRSCKIVTQKIDNLGVNEKEKFTVHNIHVSKDTLVLLNYSFISQDPDQRPMVYVDNVREGMFDIYISTFSSNAVGTFVINFVLL